MLILYKKYAVQIHIHYAHHNSNIKKLHVHAIQIKTQQAMS